MFFAILIQDNVYPELALSDKFNLVLQVARQVQVRNRNN